MRGHVIILGVISSACGVAFGAQFSTAEPAETVPFIEGEVERVDVRFSEGQWSGGGRAFPIERPRAPYLKLRFSNISETVANYALVITDRDGVMDRISKAELLVQKEYWSLPINGDFVRVHIESDDDKVGGLSMALTGIGYERAATGAPFSLPPDSDLEPIVNYRNNVSIAARAKPVAKLQFVVGTSVMSCTGFLIDETRMLTNKHCINTPEVCGSAVAVFGYELTANRLSLGERFRCASIEVHPKLDVSLLKLQGLPGSKWGQLELNARAAVEKEQAYVVQHPQGQPKHISKRECFVTSIDRGVDFGHRCSTMEGSSGSPVLGSDFTVIGIHHYGFDPIDSKWGSQNWATRMREILEWISSL